MRFVTLKEVLTLLGDFRPISSPISTVLLINNLSNTSFYTSLLSFVTSLTSFLLRFSTLIILASARLILISLFRFYLGVSDLMFKNFISSEGIIRP